MSIQKQAAVTEVTTTIKPINIMIQSAITMAKQQRPTAGNTHKIAAGKFKGSLKSLLLRGSFRAFQRMTTKESMISTVLNENNHI